MSSRHTVALLSLLTLWACSGGGRAAEPVPPPPTDLASAARVDEGRDLFERHCALCHGVHGDGHGRRRNLSKPARDLTDTTWHRTVEPRDVYRAIRDGVPASPMAAWAIFTPEQIWALVAYVDSLDGGSS